MKARMFKYLFSLLFLLVALSGNSQTINGRLYTQFNNYYKWRGGAFDSVLLLPNLTGTAGLRGGALRYNGADSSLYVYTGTQWQKIGGGGSTTDSSIFATRFWVNSNFQPIGDYITTGSSASLQNLNITGTNGNGHIHLRHQASLPTATGQSTTIYANSQGNFAWKNDGNYHTTLKTDANTADRTYTFQNKDYTLADNAEVVKYTDTSSMLDGRISSITLNTSGAIHTNPITFSRVGGAWSGTMSLSTQTANRVFAGPTTGSAATPTFRALVDADIPSTSKGIQWAGVDSSFAYASASNGVHVVDDFLAGSFGNGVTSYPSGLVPTGTISFALENTRYGIMTLGTTTSTTGTSRLSKTNLSDSLNSLFNVTSYMVKMPTLSDGTETYHVRVGMASQINTANPNGGAYFVYSTAGTPTGSAASANWQCVTGNGSSVRTWTTTSTAVTTGWTKLTVVASSSICFFYVNDVLVATHTTNIPTPALTPNYEIRKTAGTTERLLWVDYFTQDVKYSTAR